LLQECGQAVEPRRPESFVVVEPFEGVAHRLGMKPTGDDAPGLGALDEAGAGQNVEMLHHRRQRHGKRRGELAHRSVRPFGKPHHQCPPRRVGERREGAVERGVLKVNHMV
jgi:hypothetical protein